MSACARREYPSNDRRLAAILAVDVGFSRRLIIKRGGDRADEVKRQRGEKSSRISEDRP